VENINPKESAQELTTSLVGIKGMVELLKKTNLNSEQNKIVESLLDSTAYLIEKVNFSELMVNKVVDGEINYSDFIDIDTFSLLSNLDKRDNFKQDLIENFISDGNNILLTITMNNELDYSKIQESLLALKTMAAEFGALELEKLCQIGLDMEKKDFMLSTYDDFSENLKHVFDQSIIALLYFASHGSKVKSK